MRSVKLYLFCIGLILYFMMSAPAVLKAQTQTVTTGNSTAAVNFPTGNCIYNWTNDNPSIGLAASGTGNIPAFTALNNGTAPITATITVTPKPIGFAYVPNSTGRTVSVINTETQTVVNTITTGIGPVGIAISPDYTRIYISDVVTGTISFIDAATNTVTPIITGATKPMGIALTPDGNYLYVANGQSNDIWKINTITQAKTIIPVGQFSKGILVSPDGAKVYVIGSGSIISTTNDAIIGAFSRGDYAAITPDGKYIYITGGNDQITVLSTTNGTFIPDIKVGNAPYGITVSPDGSKLYVANSGSNTISIISTISNTLINTINTTGQPASVSLSPDGSLLYVTHNNNNLPGSVKVINTSDFSTVANITVGSSPLPIGNFVSAGISCGGPITFTITVNPASVPTIATSGTLSSLSTSYGTASSPTNFMVSGTNMTTGILVTPPAGFEVSTDNANYFNTVTIGSAGTIASRPVYIRLKATTAAGTYSENIVLSSGSTSLNVAMPNSTVSPFPIGIRIYAIIDYGDVLNDMTLTSSNFNFSLVNADLKNGEVATALDIKLTGGHTGKESVGVYNGVIVPSDLRGTNGFLQSNYTINYVRGPITIQPAPLVIMANSITKPYGSMLTGGPASTNFTVSGLKNRETINSVTMTYTNGSAANAPVATYNGSVIPSAEVGGNGFVPTNYDITYQAASITITPAPLTITADNKSKLYGDPNPPLTITYTGFVNGEGAAQLTTQPVANTTATQGSDVGVYPITISGGTSSNYNLNYVDGTLTIYKDITIPNAFTPNGDGINDTWKISNLNPNLTITVEIMNRYGTRVYYSSGYLSPWDGCSNGVPVPFGVYYYIIKGVKEKPLTGYITIVR